MHFSEQDSDTLSVSHYLWFIIALQCTVYFLVTNLSHFKSLNSQHMKTFQPNISGCFSCLSMAYHVNTLTMSKCLCQSHLTAHYHLTKQCHGRCGFNAKWSKMISVLKTTLIPSNFIESNPSVGSVWPSTQCIIFPHVERDITIWGGSCWWWLVILPFLFLLTLRKQINSHKLHLWDKFHCDRQTVYCYVLDHWAIEFSKREFNHNQTQPWSWIHLSVFDDLYLK